MVVRCPARAGSPRLAAATVGADEARLAWTTRPSSPWAGWTMPRTTSPRFSRASRLRPRSRWSARRRRLRNTAVAPGVKPRPTAGRGRRRVQAERPGHRHDPWRQGPDLPAGDVLNQHVLFGMREDEHAAEVDQGRAEPQRLGALAGQLGREQASGSPWTGTRSVAACVPTLAGRKEMVTVHSSPGRASCPYRSRTPWRRPRRPDRSRPPVRA